MATRLSSLLVRDGVVDVGTMEQAFRRKDLEGGRLGTVLLELRAVDDITLQFYLSRAVGLPAPSEELLASIDENVLGLLDVATVMRSGAIPAAIEGGDLAVLVRDPLDEDAIGLVSSTVQRSIRQYVLPDFRFEHALADLYGVRPSGRTARLIARYPAQIGAVGMAVGESASRPAVREPGTKAENLFADVSTAWTSDQLGRFLAHAHDRDDIVQAVLGFARGHFPHCLMLAVQHGQLWGFAGRGLGVDDDRLRRIRLKDARVLRDAQARGGESVFLGLPQDLGLSRLYDEIGLNWPTEVACFVLRVGSRPALLLAGDNDGRPISRPLIPAVELAVNQAANALVRVVRERKKARETGEEELSAEATAPFQAVERESVDDLALVKLDDGWGFFDTDVFDSVVPLVDSQDEVEQTVDTAAAHADAEYPEGERQDTIPDGLLATDDRAPIDSDESTEEPPQSLLADDDEVDEEDLDALMFGEIERLVLEEHGIEGDDHEGDDHEGDVERVDTLLGIGGVATGQDAGHEHAVPDVEPFSQVGEGDAAELEATQPQVAVQATVPDDLAEPEAIVEALLSGDEARALKAKAALLLGEPEALKALEERFPGPIRNAPKDPKKLPPLAETGPLLKAVAELGQRFSPELWDLMQSSDRNKRYYATFCCAEVRHPENVPALADRLFDDDPAIQRLATQILRTNRRSAHIPGVLKRLRGALAGDDVPATAAAARALGELGDVEAVPLLIDRVGSEHDVVADSCQHALERIVFQGFGPEKKKWLKWYNKNAKRSRIEWLLEGVTHKQVYIREIVKSVIDETPGLDVELQPNAGRRDLKRAQSALAEQIRKKPPEGLA